MKPMMFLGIILIVLGVVALLLQFITVTTHMKGVHIGPFKTSSTDAKTTIPVSPFLGGLVLAGGIVLVIIGRKKKP